ncbi:MAG: peroxidase [Planctomycetota bacterium]|nr:peroxidase [Planctomycetota bacterium]
MTEDDKLVEDIKEDFEEADVNEPTKALLLFACRATHRATDIRKEDVDELRAAGFSDRAILDGVMITGLFNYFNLIADALGIDLELDMPAREENLGEPTVEDE